MTKNKGFDEKDLFAKIKKGNFEIMPHISAEPKALVEKLLKINPRERLTIDQVKDNLLREINFV